MSADFATLSSALRAASRQLDRLDARLLLEYVTGCRHADLIARGDSPLTASQQQQFDELIRRRLAGEPLAYLVGEAEFRGLTLAVSPAVLVPRPETELLVELALQRIAGLPAPRLVDLGTGSGAIAIAIAVARPDAQVLAVDQSPAALAVAAANAARHGVALRCLQSDWYQALAGEQFALIVSNPPYIAAGDPHLQGDGLRFEPEMALTDGGDGLSCLRHIIAAAPAHLYAGGSLLLEHGYDQAASCRNLLAAAGFQEVDSWRDLAGIERVSGGCLA